MARTRLSVDFSGLLAQLEEAGNAALPAAKVGLYETAGAVADAVKAEAGTLPYDPATVSQIRDAVGVSVFRDGAGETQTSVGVEGYFAHSGFPIPFFVNEIEHGTSRMPARPFMRNAARRVQAEAEAKGNRAAEQFAQKILDKITDK